MGQMWQRVEWRMQWSGAMWICLAFKICLQDMARANIYIIPLKFSAFAKFRLNEPLPK